MIKIKILAFAIAKEIIGAGTLEIELNAGDTVAVLKSKLCKRYPDFEKLSSLRIAVNEEYREDDFILKQADEVVIIPPVSGG